MRKASLILLAGVLAALILGDVIEIRWHPEKLMELPKTVLTFARDNATYIKIRDQVLGWKSLAGQVAGITSKE